MSIESILNFLNPKHDFDKLNSIEDDPGKYFPTYFLGTAKSYFRGAVTGFLIGSMILEDPDTLAAICGTMDLIIYVGRHFYDSYNDKAYKKKTADCYDNTLWRDKFDSKPSEDLGMFFLGVSGAVLDVGCGMGCNSSVLIENYDVVALDLAQEALKYTASRGVTSLVSDMEFLPFRTDSFDAIWANDCYGHLRRKNIQTALNDAYRVLKPNGKIFVSVTEGVGDEWVCDENLKEYKFNTYFQKEEVCDMMEFAGFDVTSSVEDGIVKVVGSK